MGTSSVGNGKTELAGELPVVIVRSWFCLNGLMPAAIFQIAVRLDADD